VIRESVYQDHAGCIEISNGTASVIVSTAFGPRVLSYSLDGGVNILGWHPDAAVQTDLGTWKPHGGHRLWLAPEDMPLSYSPDNDAIECVQNSELSVTLVPKPDLAAGIKKQMTVMLDEAGSGVTIEHRITNVSVEPKHIAAWALTIMRPGGVVIVPNEPAQGYGSDTLLPIRSMALWSYTDFTDPRWSFKKDEIRLRVDETLGHPQKFGVLNKQGWAAYECEGLRFTKRFEFVEDATYPDMHSNTEVYTAGSFVEVETLSPLATLAPGDVIDHREAWSLSQVLP
jgi:hypothetical protein